MATLNASKWGFITSNNQSSQTAARDATTGTATVNPTTSTSAAIEYARLAGRGRGSSIYRVTRTFYYFDTSGITGTLTGTTTLNIKGTTTANADVIVVPSTAFSGDGSTNLANDDINNISFNTNYAAEYTGWTNNNSNNAITLRSPAAADIQNNNYFICAVIQYDNDYLNNDPGTNVGQLNNSINFFTTAYLDYQVASSSNITSLNGIARASITSFNTIALASIDQINGIDN